MKSSLIALVIAFIYALTASGAAFAEDTTTTKTKVIYKTVYACPKHKKKKVRTYRTYRTYYEPIYCEYRRSACNRCGYEEYCYPARVYRYECRTEVYYHRGRNYTNVQVCN